jgi:cytochrome c
VLKSVAEAALQRFVVNGGGFVGIHSATDTEYDWPFYQRLIGAPFQSHPAIQKASVVVENAQHPATQHLPATWSRTDEWYNFKRNPRNDVTVLLRLDEASYQPGPDAMGKDHPIAWSARIDFGRSFYSALGHTDESWSEPDFVTHVAQGIAWAGGLAR